MSLNPRDVASQLEHKFGFSRREGNHHFFSYEVAPEKWVITKVSHNRKPLSDGLVSKMARDLKVPTGFFRCMIQCTRSKADYELQVLTAPTSPWPDYPK